MSTISSFKDTHNKRDYIGKDCMKKLYKFLREHAVKITTFILYL